MVFLVCAVDPCCTLTHPKDVASVKRREIHTACSFFSDLRHGRAPVEREHYRQPLSKVCLEQFLYENGTQLLCIFGL